MELKHHNSYYFVFCIHTFNRTLWNWNANNRRKQRRNRKLLIVPYGIETKELPDGMQAIQLLLIVPYGIETKWYLIDKVDEHLLIVPYGIETFQAHGRLPASYFPFNRTLWNWNALLRWNRSRQSILLIVPYGIETFECALSASGLHLLIVPYGIETSLSRCNNSVFSLLIVPYGIETRDLRVEWIQNVELLIVPYGIET